MRREREGRKRDREMERGKREQERVTMSEAGKRG
jgi:hypothetical protein